MGRPQLALNIVFGTHNIDSLTEIITKLEAEGLAFKNKAGKLRVRNDAVGKVAIAQLYGRS
jgi:proline dehydrogenase